jgi:cellulose synthase/poly-beta-1,6-N-acetylglucosamine synthase-like glycosyltransferase
MINGSGFMVSMDVIKKQGGWHTKTMTEDIEFTTLCVLSGEKVQWIPDAVIYDEQPLTFEQSWKQRKRWSTGLIQNFELYSSRLFKNAITKKNISSFDLMMFFITPILQILYLASIILTILLALLYVKHDYFPQTDVYYRLFLSLDFSYFVSFAMAFGVVLLEKKKTSKMLKGILTFWLFIISWMPINILCILRKQTQWDQIKHTRVVEIDELVSEEK